jgi:hypothetical protein
VGSLSSAKPQAQPATARTSQLAVLGDEVDVLDDIGVEAGDLSVRTCAPTARASAALGAVRRGRFRGMSEGPWTHPAGYPVEPATVIAAAMGQRTEKFQQMIATVGAFAPAAEVPKALVGALWQGAHDWDRRTTDEIMVDLVDTGVLLESGERGRAFRIPDRIHVALRELAGPQLLTAASAGLLDLIAPDVGPPTDALRATWWRLPDGHVYLWRHLCHHLAEAGRTDELVALVTDHRWLTARIDRFGTADALTDLDLADAPAAVSVRAALARLAPVLDGSDPLRRADLVERVAGGQAVAADQSTAAAGGSSTSSRPSSPPSPPPSAGRSEPPTPTGPQRSGLPGPDFLPPPVPDQPPRRLAVVWLHDSGSEPTPTSCAVAPDGHWLAVGDREGRIRLFDPGTGRPERVLTGEAGSVGELAVTPDGATLVALMEEPHRRRIDVWDVATGSVRARIHQPTFGLGWSFTDRLLSPTGGWLALPNGQLELYSLDGARIRAVDVGFTREVAGWTAGTDGAGLYGIDLGGGIRYVDTDSGEVRIVAEGREHHAFKARYVGRTGWRSTVLGPDGSWLVNTGTAVAVVAPGARRLHSIPCGPSPVPRRRVSPDGQRVAWIRPGATQMQVHAAGSLLPAADRPPWAAKNTSATVVALFDSMELDQLQWDDLGDAEATDRYLRRVGFTDVCWLPDGEKLFAVSPARLLLLAPEPGRPT